MKQIERYRATSTLAMRMFFLLIVVTLSLLAVSTSFSADQKGSSRYAVNLLSKKEPIDVSSIPVVKEFRYFRVYKTRAKVKGEVWHRLRIGMFTTRQEADRVLSSLRHKYPDAWVTKVSGHERDEVGKAKAKVAPQKSAKSESLLSRFKKKISFPDSKREEKHRGRDFNHDTTGFILEGAHKATRCDTCHARGIFKGTPKTCSGCHSSSARVAATAKSASHIKTGVSCAQCHSEDSWFRLTRMDHTGITGQCAACHNSKKGHGKSSNHITSGDNCSDCHTTLRWSGAQFDHNNIQVSCIACHNGRKAEGKGKNHIASGNNCEDCHSPAGNWSAARVDHSTLTGSCSSCHSLPSKHISTSSQCDACHSAGGNWGSAKVDHSTLTGSCSSCHSLPSKHISTSSQCDACHSAGGNWGSAKVDHSTLTGSCSSCHSLPS
ncbi:MAG: cytochrome c3 family protein, partial [Thermodesulfobacteriota bacterium]